MYPIRQTKTGTGICTAIFPDIFQNPFNIGIGVQLLTGGLTTAIVSVEHTFDYQLVMQPSFNGATGLVDGSVQTAIWFPNSGMNSTTITANVATGIVTASVNYAFAVAALRFNVVSATATSVLVVNFIQSVNSP